MIVYQNRKGNRGMELIVIDERRIKLMLTAEDMKAYRSAAEESGTGEALRGILRDAGEKCGYRGDGMRGRIYVEMYPSKTGGCEVFVTKLAERENRTSMKSGNERMLAEYRNYIFRGRVIYRFETMPVLLGACAGLMQSGYRGESSAYREETAGCGAYYLILEHESHVAAEHLGSLCKSSVYYYINEHCRKLCADAVPILGKLA